MSPALQLYTVRDQLAQDFAGTLRRVREIGYRAVETYPFPSGISSQAAAEILQNLGLEVVSMHCDLPQGEALPGIVQTAHDLQCRKIIWHGWPKPLEFDSLAGVRQLAARYNDARQILQDHALDFGLHNHWWELEPVDGSLPYKIFDQLLHPEIFLEIDTYWVQTAGLNPASIVSELARRVQFLHLKDGPAIVGQPMTALGTGLLDFPSILAAAHPLPQLVVELDECATDIFTAIRQSLRSLEQTLGFV